MTDIPKLRDLMPEEIEHLNQSERCSNCKHLMALHHESEEAWDAVCMVGLCRCVVDV